MGGGNQGEGGGNAAPVLSVVPGRPDHEVAENYKRQLIEKMAPAMELMNQAKRAGFFINFAVTDGGINDLNGRREIVGLQVIKLAIF